MLGREHEASGGAIGGLDLDTIRTGVSLGLTPVKALLGKNLKFFSRIL